MRGCELTRTRARLSSFEAQVVPGNHKVRAVRQSPTITLLLAAGGGLQFGSVSVICGDDVF
jgi:hypothetical protein